MFYELRQYRTRPGQREAWVRYMEEVIIPFQVSKGMVILGSWVGEQEDDLYVWIRRFESEHGARAAQEPRPSIRPTSGRTKSLRAWTRCSTATRSS